MLVSEFLEHVNYALRGNDDDAPEIGSDDANLWIATLNRKKDELYRNSRVLWNESFKTTAPNETGTVATSATTTLTGTNTKFLDYRVGDKITVSGETVRTIATITSNTSLTVTVAFSNTASSKTFTRTTVIASDVDTYSLHRTFIAPSDSAEILKTDGNKVYYDFIQPRQRDRNVRRFFISGKNPKLLTFSSTIASTEAIVGGSLTVPGYYMPDDVSLATDELVLPDPYWGVMSVASEVAFSDLTYEDKAESLNTKANALYIQMVRNNRRGAYGNPYKTPTNVYKIRSAERY